MKFLILSQYYAPEPTARAHELGSSLSQRGHEVIAITGFPSYPFGKIYDGYRMRLWEWERREGVSVLRLPLFPDHSRSVTRRGLYYASFATSASVFGPLVASRVDAMYVYLHPPTIGIAAGLIRLLRGVPFVCEIQDLWPESLIATGMVRNRPLLNSLDSLERLVYRHSAAIVVVSPGFTPSLIRKGVPAEKIHVISNWADESVHRPIPPSPSLAQETGMWGRFNVLYTGNIGPAQALETVLEAAENLQDLHEVQFVLAGDGVERPYLEAAAAKRKLSNVRFLGQQPLERMPDLYALADVLLVHLRRDPLFTTTIPSKMLGYLASGKPILAAAPGEATEIVLQAGAGLACEAQDASALASAIRRFYAMPQGVRIQMGEAGREVFLQKYSRGALVSRYEQLLQSVARCRSPVSRDRRLPAKVAP
jgi:colanic acid biosynthesis glycosyl transferase WcaI